MFDLLGGDLADKLTRELEIMKEAAATGSLDALVEVHEEEEWQNADTSSVSSKDSASEGNHKVGANGANQPHTLEFESNPNSPDLAPATPQNQPPDISQDASQDEGDEPSFSFDRAHVLSMASDEAQRTVEDMFQHASPTNSVSLSDALPSPNDTTAIDMPGSSSGNYHLNAQVQALLEGKEMPTSVHPHSPTPYKTVPALSPPAWTSSSTLDPRHPDFLSQFGGKDDVLPPPRSSHESHTPPSSSSTGPAIPDSHLSDSSLDFWGIGGPGGSSAGQSGMNAFLSPLTSLGSNFLSASSPPQPTGSSGDISAMNYSDSDAFDPILASIKGSSAAPQQGTQVSPQQQGTVQKWGQNAFSALSQAVSSGLSGSEPSYYQPVQRHDPRPSRNSRPRQVTNDDPFARLAADSREGMTGMACLPIDPEFWERYKYTIYVVFPGLLLLVVYYRFSYTEESV